MYKSCNSIYLSDRIFDQKEILLLSMLSALSKHIVPVNSTYQAADRLLSYGVYGSIKLDNNCILRCMTDDDKPAIPGQNQSFLKLGIQRPLDGLTGWDPIFIIMLVDLVDGKIPEDYRARVYKPGFERLLDCLSTREQLYDDKSYSHFFNVVLQAATSWPDNFSISTVEDLSAGAIPLTLSPNNIREII